MAIKVAISNQTDGLYARVMSRNQLLDYYLWSIMRTMVMYNLPTAIFVSASKGDCSMDALMNTIFRNAIPNVDYYYYPGFGRQNNCFNVFLIASFSLESSTLSFGNG